MKLVVCKKKKVIKLRRKSSNGRQGLSMAFSNFDFTIFESRTKPNLRSVSQICEIQIEDLADYPQAKHEKK